MIRKIIALVILGVGFVILSVLINNVETTKVAVLLYGSSKTHIDQYREAYHIYRKDHPHSRFEVVEIHVSRKTNVRDLVEKLRNERFKFVVLPYSSSFVDSFAQKAKNYGFILISPLAMLSKPHENVIRTIPNFEDMARTLARYLKSSGYDSVGIFAASNERFKRVVDGMKNRLERELSSEGLNYTELKDPSFERDIPIVVVALFPSDVSKNMKFLFKDREREVILFTSNVRGFRSFYGYNLEGFKYVSEKFYKEKAEFVKEYAKMFGKVPSWSVAAVYDAFSLVEYALMMDIKDVDSLRALKSFHGIQGDIPLSEDPDMSSLLFIDEF